MRFLRFALFQAYISSIQKNKKKALLIINIGIFLSIFAFSSATISFFIEKKISEIQSDLTFSQISLRETNNSISQMENELNSLQKRTNQEKIITDEKRFLDEFKIHNKLLSSKDYYGPFIYHNLKDAKKEIEDIQKLYGINVFDKNDPFYVDYLIPLLKDSWEKDEFDDFIEAIEELDFYTRQLLRINIDNYFYQKPLTINEIVDDINNEDLSSLNLTSNIFNDYESTIGSYQAMLKYYQAMLNVNKGFKGQGEEDVALYEKNILYYSNLERNIILITFIFQFSIFVIIQIFEINSVNFNLKKNK